MKYNGKEIGTQTDTIPAPTATITIDKSNKKIEVELTALASAVVTFNCTNANCGKTSVTLSPTQKLSRFFSILNPSMKASIDVSVEYKGKILKSVSETINPELSCTMSFTSDTVNGKDIYKVVATVIGGTGTLTGKGDGTYNEDVANTKYSKVVTSGGKYEFTAKDTSGKQADCSITLADQYQIVKITQTKSAGEILKTTDNCKSGDSVICTNIYYIKYDRITYDNYKLTNRNVVSGICVASDSIGTKNKTETYTECEQISNVGVCNSYKVDRPCKGISTFTGTAKKERMDYSTSYYFQASLTSAMQSCNMTYSKCYTVPAVLKQTIRNSYEYGNWISYRESCPLDKRCYWNHKLIKSN